MNLMLGGNYTKQKIMRIQQRGFKNPLSCLAMAFILSLLVLCSSNPENAIVGKWSVIDGTETMECFTDGTLMQGHRILGSTCE